MTPSIQNHALEAEEIKKKIVRNLNNNNQKKFLQKIK